MPNKIRPHCIYPNSVRGNSGAFAVKNYCSVRHPDDEGAMPSWIYGFDDTWTFEFTLELILEFQEQLGLDPRKYLNTNGTAIKIDNTTNKPVLRFEQEDVSKCYTETTNYLLSEDWLEEVKEKVLSEHLRVKSGMIEKSITGKDPVIPNYDLSKPACIVSAENYYQLIRDYIPAPEDLNQSRVLVYHRKAPIFSPIRTVEILSKLDSVFKLEPNFYLNMNEINIHETRKSYRFTYETIDETYIERTISKLKLKFIMEDSK